MRLSVLIFSPLVVAGALLVQCSDNQTTPADAGNDVAIQPEAAVEAAAPTFCETQSLSAVPFSAGPYGIHRQEIAADFTVPTAEGPWSFKERFTGCELYVFIPDTIPVSANDTTPIWNADLDKLVAISPKNVHYFFVGAKSSVDQSNANVAAMQTRIADYLTTLSEEDAAHWATHLHVVTTRAHDLGNWVGDALHLQAYTGLCIDRFQRVRGVGQLADVKRYDDALQASGKWPWKANLAYAAYEAQYMNAQFDQQKVIDASGATIVKLWDGDVLSEFADTDATLPSASEMAKFDTLEVEVTMGCPNPDKVEFNNCGAWDYIAALYLNRPLASDGGAPEGGADAGPSVEQLELARFITSYHRETHWVVDATPMLVLLKDGGTQSFRWSFAPPWNTQPTATKLSLRFSNKKRGYRPTTLVPLFTGGAFNSTYNDKYTPVVTAIPSSAKHVDLFVIVTGHGGQTANCAEFCNHQHEFTVNTKKLLKEFPEVGKNDGCVAQTTKGMTPNQGGTWWFGRGGWCPGWQVDPWVTDVTSNVTAGSNATISYRGLIGGTTPPDDSGNIDLTSYLVISE